MKKNDKRSITNVCRLANLENSQNKIAPEVIKENADFTQIPKRKS